jgi:hypothetical protein
VFLAAVHGWQASGPPEASTNREKRPASFGRSIHPHLRWRW